MRASPSPAIQVVTEIHAGTRAAHAGFPYPGHSGRYRDPCRNARRSCGLPLPRPFRSLQRSTQERAPLMRVSPAPAIQVVTETHAGTRAAHAGFPCPGHSGRYRDPRRNACRSCGPPRRTGPTPAPPWESRRTARQSSSRRNSAAVGRMAALPGQLSSLRRYPESRTQMGCRPFPALKRVFQNAYRRSRVQRDLSAGAQLQASMIHIRSVAPRSARSPG